MPPKKAKKGRHRKRIDKEDDGHADREAPEASEAQSEAADDADHPKQGVCGGKEFSVKDRKITWINETIQEESEKPTAHLAEAPTGSLCRPTFAANSKKPPPVGIEKSQLNQRCQAWMKTLCSLPVRETSDELAAEYCQYGLFLKSEKERLAGLGENQVRRSKIISSNYGAAMRAGKQGQMDKFRKQSEDNERAFEVNKLEIEVLNYHLNVFKGEKIYLQLDNFRDKMAVQVGDAACNEFVMKPEIDLPDISFESALEEEQELAAYMKAQREEKARLKSEEKAREKALKEASA